jgi:hypothetical protein
VQIQDDTRAEPRWKYLTPIRNDPAFFAAMSTIGGINVLIGPIVQELDRMATSLRIHHGPMFVGLGASTAVACYADFASDDVDVDDVMSVFLHHVEADPYWKGSGIAKPGDEAGTFSFGASPSFDGVNPVIDLCNDLRDRHRLEKLWILQALLMATAKYAAYAAWHCGGCVSLDPSLPTGVASAYASEISSRIRLLRSPQRAA